MSIPLHFHNFSGHEKADIIRYVILAALILSALLTLRRHQNQPLLKYALYWVVIAVVLLFLYSFKTDFQDIKNRFVTTLYPSHVVQKDGELVIHRSSNGHFELDALINGHKVHFMVDTGASLPLLGRDTAENLGIQLSDSDFYMQSSTANGTGKLAEIFVSIQIGEFIVDNIRIGVNSVDSDNLLGMSLLNKFKSVEIEGDVMTLKY